MTQLRQDYQQFAARNTEILVIGPEDAKAFTKYFNTHDLPFTGLPDPKHTVLKQYGQEIKLFKFGRMPAQIVVDKQGVARYVHYGHDMKDIPANADMLATLDELNAEAS